MLRNSQALLAAVDAATITLQLHSSSPHAEPHRENLLRWLDLAVALNSMIKQLMEAQEMWTLLKQLFLCPSHYSSMPSQVRLPVTCCWLICVSFSQAGLRVYMSVDTLPLWAMGILVLLWHGPCS
jgi:hypothetical protein